VLQSALTNRLNGESARAHERSEQWWTAVTGNALLAGSLGLSPGAGRQWEEFNRAHIAAAYSVGKRTSFVKAIARTVRIGSQIALYGLGAWLVVKGEMTPGALVASAILLARALAPLELLVGAMRHARAALESYRRLRQLPPDASLPRIGAGDQVPAGRVVLADVTYYHPTRRAPALRSVSITVEPGQSLGIVGANGSGKSTLAAILAGAALPTSGTADLDGIPISKWQRGEGMPPVGYLPDDPCLIEGSVHANICRFGDASLIAVARAAMRAGVHDTLAALVAGYDTEVGPGGSGLALRERRSVAFARALFGNPRVVVFDEPELGLDGGSLRRLVDTLKTLKSEGVSVVVATQDPRLLAATDRIVVMNAGAIEAQGTPQELSRRFAMAARPAAEMH
jgi:ABC-type protease/lipase transport system fused ATPase/permease subunit